MSFSSLVGFLERISNSIFSYSSISLSNIILLLLTLSNLLNKNGSLLNGELSLELQLEYDELQAVLII